MMAMKLCKCNTKNVGGDAHRLVLGQCVIDQPCEQTSLVTDINMMKPHIMCENPFE